MPSAALAELILAKRAVRYTPGQSIQELRRVLEESASKVPLLAGTNVRWVDAGGVAAAWIDAPRVQSDRVILFLHGGGYFRSSVAASKALAANISAAARFRCLSVEYRLAPENPFPAALDDADRAYQWLVSAGFAPNRIVVAGISAGGGLGLALLLRLRDGSGLLPAAGVALSPWTDLTQSGDSYSTRAHVDPTVSKAYLDRMAALYLAGADPRHPLASPLHAELAGLPPLLIQVGTAETLMNDSTHFAARARAAGVDVCLETWEDMIHSWHDAAHRLPEAREALARVGEFARRQMT
jgi:acetyl esterase/lipase